MKKLLLTFICCLALPAEAFAYNASDVQQVQNGISCPCADLSGADLSGLNLNGINLRGANLNGARLADTDLSGADLQNANMHRAVFKNLSLIHI